MTRLSSAAIAGAAAQIGTTIVDQALIRSNDILKDADQTVAQKLSEAKKKAAKIYNNTIDSIFLDDDQGLHIYDSQGKEHDFFSAPSPIYCMTVDFLNEKLYFIIERESHPIDNNTRKLAEATLLATSLTGSNAMEIRRMQYNVPIEVEMTGSLDIQPAEQKIIWIDPTGSIYSMDFKGDHYQELAKTDLLPKSPSVSAVMSSTGMLYWTAMERSIASGNTYGIWQMDKDSKDIRRLFNYPVSHIETEHFRPRLQIDETNHKLYWNSPNKIESLSLENGEHKIIYQSTVSITGLELDPLLNRLYWIEDNRTLIRSTLDGQTIELALELELNERPIRNLFLRTKADKAAGILHSAQSTHQGAVRKVADDISTANKNADIFLSPFLEAYRTAEAKFQQDITPAQEQADSIITPARTKYSENVQYAKNQLAESEAQSQQIREKALADFNNQVKQAETECNNRIKIASKELEETRAKK